MVVRKSDHKALGRQVDGATIRRAAAQALESAVQSVAQARPTYAVVEALAIAVEPTLSIEPASRDQRFATGRAALRRAAAGVGFELGEVPRDAERGAPLLPDGLVGSISHTRGISMAVVTRATAGSLGLDIERCAPERPRIERRVLTPVEATRIMALSGFARWRAVVALFSAKEAAFKALDKRVGDPALTFRSLEVTSSDDGAVVVRVLAAPTIAANVGIAQDDDLTVAIAAT